jgi:hypothetical protein
MKKAATLSLLVILLGLCGWTTIEPDAGHIVWDEFRPLSWEDFRGTVNHASHADAATAISISARPYMHKKRIFYVVDARFIPDQSWCRARSESLLRHEQLHFDIAELYARKARKKISEYRQMGVRDIAEYNAAISKILEESNRIDVKYDFETLHGSLPGRQSSWEKQIALELEILRPFARANWK